MFLSNNVQHVHARGAILRNARLSEMGVTVHADFDLSMTQGLCYLPTPEDSINSDAVMEIGECIYFDPIRYSNMSLTCPEVLYKEKVSVVENCSVCENKLYFYQRIAHDRWVRFRTHVQDPPLGIGRRGYFPTVTVRLFLYLMACEKLNKVVTKTFLSSFLITVRFLLKFYSRFLLN